MTETQKERVLTMLKDAHPDGVCVTVFLEQHMGRTAARVFDLRRDGFDIELVRCEEARHRHRTRQYQYVLRNLEPFTMTMDHIDPEVVEAVGAFGVSLFPDGTL